MHVNNLFPRGAWKRSVTVFLLFVTIVAVVTTVCFRQTLTFGFWKDDWVVYWGARNNHPLFLSYWFHPATTLEFLILSKILSPFSLYWQIVGLAEKVFASLGASLFVYSITKSKKAMYIAGLLSGVSPIGMDTVGWVSGHVVNVTLGFIGLSFWSYELMLKRKTFFSVCTFLLVLFFTLASDPWRVFPLVAFLFMAGWTDDAHRMFVKTVFSKLSLVVLFLLPFFLYWQRERIVETQPYILFRIHGSEWAFYAAKLYVVGNYVNSIFNIVFGWFLSVPEYLSTGEYNRIHARIGLFVILAFLLLFLVKRKKQPVRIVGFFFLWACVMYIPSWIVEPRLTMGVTHRYMGISSFGVIGILSYVLSLVPKHWFSVASFFIFVLMSVRTQQFLHLWMPFRSRAFIERIWRQVDADVTRGETNRIFFITGSHPVVANTINYSGSIPFGVLRGVTNAEHFPLMTDISGALRYVCRQDEPRRVFGLPVRSDTGVLLSEVYGWDINTSGKLRNVSSIVKEELMKQSSSMPGCLIQQE